MELTGKAAKTKGFIGDAVKELSLPANTRAEGETQSIVQAAVKEFRTRMFEIK